MKQPHKILLGLTTTRGSDWRKKIEDTKRLHITEIALFLTGLGAPERQELYALLRETPVTRIPHVHLRDDMTMAEIAYLIEKYQVRYFNIHPALSKYPAPGDYAQYERQIYVENTGVEPSLTELTRYAGLCIDFSHWEKGRGSTFKNFQQLADTYPIGCCHVSAVRFSWLRLRQEDEHTLKYLTDLDYMKKYVSYVPEVVSLELENDFDSQLQAKAYLQKIVG